MTRDLLLLRRGKPVKDWDGPDRNRPLSDRGKRQVQRIGAWLAENGKVPEHVVTSCGERAEVSAQKALKAAGVDARGVQRDARLDDAIKAVPLEVLRDLGAEQGRTMLVLNGKALRRLLAYLLPGKAPKTSAGTLVHLHIPDDWSALASGCARLQEVFHPKDLPAGFPFDGPDGREWRDRPAYYYTQSAVLPYRQGQTGTEFLLISSSKRNHWVVPKGIHDPGYTAQESAAREAEEEAGILGEVSSDPIGVFELFKWGASCRVTVYPMKVTTILDAPEWEESHRSRTWVSRDQAIERLKHEGLRDIVAGFVASPLP